MSAKLKEELLRLLREDEEFRLAVAGLIGLEEVLRRLARLEEELVRLREDMIRGFERHEKILERHEERLASLEERLVSLEKRLVELREDMARGFELMQRHLDALGARWGLMAESAFREGLRGLLGKELGLKAERWTGFDEEGLVYGHPAVVEVDVAVKNGRLLLVEVSSHVRASDIAAFKRKASLYARATGRAPDKLIVVTPFVEEKALETAKRLGVEVYTAV